MTDHEHDWRYGDFCISTGEYRSRTCVLCQERQTQRWISVDRPVESARDDLATLISEMIDSEILDQAVDYWPETKPWGERIADAAIAAGWHR